MNINVEKMAEEIIILRKRINSLSSYIVSRAGIWTYEDENIKIKDVIDEFKIIIPNKLKFQDNEIDINKIEPKCCDTLFDDIEEFANKYIIEENDKITKEGNNEINGVKV